ncbi:hypothetical protein [Mannheimia haemolytica]|uniref:hypothetical protein n=1 Tax=Mannheimia haemolytica TaxID=75985 RepID=UPI0013772103|nr:hypothetical protein [Mannheimia haemolytica]NBB67538.1 hypothetical protein [Mannheimia haemolytica]
MQNNPTYTPTLASIFSKLDNLLAFLNKVQSGKPIYWENPKTGNINTATRGQNLAYIEDQILIIACDVDELRTRILQLAGETQNETN